MKQRPPLFSIILKDFMSDLEQCNTSFSKIQLIQGRVRDSEIERGIIFYENHSNHDEKTPTPAIWQGILNSKYGIVKREGDSDSDEEQFARGVEQWKTYCILKQLEIDYLSGIEPMNNDKPVTQVFLKSSPVTPFEINMLNRLIEVEDKIKDKISQWRRGLDKIQCAAFCEVLFDLHYFEKGSDRIKTLEGFAQTRYGARVKNQLLASKRDDRKIHKDLLIGLFK